MFIGGVDLLDFPPARGKVTWFHSNGRAMNSVDIILISKDRLTSLGKGILWVLPRDVVD